MKHNNERVLKFGFSQAKRIIEARLQQSLMAAADALLLEVVKNREFPGFTGNTQTSYACGVYLNGVLVHAVFQKTWTDPPVRMKVRKGKAVFLSRPYEGDARDVTGAVDIVENHGRTLSMRQLEEFRAPRKGLALMMTTGTEYSVFIENVLDMDVLTKTFLDAGSVINRSWKTIDKDFFS